MFIFHFSPKPRLERCELGPGTYVPSCSEPICVIKLQEEIRNCRLVEACSLACVDSNDL